MKIHDTQSASKSAAKRATQIKEILKRRKEGNKTSQERKKFLQWAMPELKRIAPEQYRRKAELKTDTVQVQAQLQPTEITIPSDEPEKFVFNLGPTPKLLAHLVKARNIKTTRQRETKNQKILSLLERKLATQENLTRNDVTLIRLAKFATEEIRLKFLELAKKEENRYSEAAYLIGKNSTTKRYLDGRFKGVLDNGLFIWVYENKDLALARGVLNTTLQEPKYTDPRSETTAKNRLEARTEVYILFSSWEALGPEKAKTFNVNEHTNDVAMRSELILFGQDELNAKNKASLYLGQNKTIATYQNVRKLIEWAMKNPNHVFAAGLGLNLKLLLYKDLQKLASWADLKENSKTLLAKNLHKQINDILRKSGHQYTETYSMTEAIMFLKSLQKTCV